MYWYTYLAQCGDGNLYTGITTNIKRREIEHNTNDKRGAKSLRGKRPVRMVYYERYNSQIEARRREIEIKSWKRQYKIKLILQ
jgi:putative endonuclease